ncbi:MAG: hypothetical protein HOV79_00340 [Hamadaea sp.]|nr:hypothetical protein [Hamadaea sp.]
MRAREYAANAAIAAVALAGFLLMLPLVVGAAPIIGLVLLFWLCGGRQAWRRLRRNRWTSWDEEQLHAFALRDRAARRRRQRYYNDGTGR